MKTMLTENPKLFNDILAGLARVYRNADDLKEVNRFAMNTIVKAFADDIQEKYNQTKNHFQKEKKKVLVFSMAFVADCLETIHEVGTEYQELFEEHGGEKIQLIPSLNDDDSWIKFLYEMVTSPR